MTKQEVTTARRIGRYELISYLGSGGMSDVYCALHTGLQKRVALKLLRSSLRSDTRAVARFLREGECAARVSHPHVVAVSDVGVDERVPYLVMELLEGETLAQKLEREGRLELEAAVDLLLPILGAVAAAHDASVLHRDIKPANILLSRASDGSLVPKLVDFGIAVIQDPGGEVRAGLVGTPYYMSPEQARGDVVDERSDQYSLASVLFEMLTGREPYAGGSVREILVQVAQGRFPRPSTHCAALPDALDAVLLKATAREAERRYASVREFAARLLPFASERVRDEWLAREQRTGVLDAPLPAFSIREPKRRRGRAVEPAAPKLRERALVWGSRLLGGTALLMLGVGAGLGVTRGEAEERPENRAASMYVGPISLYDKAPQAPRRPLRLRPASAMLELDGVRLGRGHVALPELPELGHDLHALRVSAPGHVARVILFRGALPEDTIALQRKR